MTCLECGNKIGAFRRRFMTTEYCSEACHQTARQKQQAAALAVLLSNKQRHQAAAQAEAKVEAQDLNEPARPAVQEQTPAPAPAPFNLSIPQAQASVPLSRTHGDPALVEADTHWREADLRASPPGLVPGGSVSVMAPLRRPAALPRPEMSVMETAFPAARTVSVRHSLRPLWVDYTAEPAPQPAAAECIRQSLPLTRTRAGSLAAIPASEFSGSIFLPEDQLPPCGAEFGARTVCQAMPQPQIQKLAPAGRPLTPELRPLAPEFSLGVNCAIWPPGASRASAKAARILPPSCLPALSTCTPEMEALQSWVTIEAYSATRNSCRPRSAAWAQVARTKLAVAPRQSRHTSAPVPWRQEIGWSPARQLRAVPPRWQMAAAAADPEVGSTREVGPAAEAVRRRWLRLPHMRPWHLRLVCILLLSLSAAGVIARLSTHHAASAAGWWESLKNTIRQRAALEMEDDFRAGLSHWNGAPDWAKSWSYDATGVLHPGKLALYQESENLYDYRVEFLAVIEKRSLGWAYRASDVRNYYAAKLVIARHGPVPALNLERFAVIDGHEEQHVQLPLPVFLANITTFRVRTDVEGSRFTTYIDGKVVDTWSDDRLTRGGVGFFADPDTVAGIHWLHVNQRDDLIGRWCAQLSWLLADKKSGEARH